MSRGTDGRWALAGALLAAVAFVAVGLLWRRDDAGHAPAPRDAAVHDAIVEALAETRSPVDDGPPPEPRTVLELPRGSKEIVWDAVEGGGTANVLVSALVPRPPSDPLDPGNPDVTLEASGWFVRSTNGNRWTEHSLLTVPSAPAAPTVAPRAVVAGGNVRAVVHWASLDTGLDVAFTVPDGVGDVRDFRVRPPPGSGLAPVGSVAAWLDDPSGPLLVLPVTHEGGGELVYLTPGGESASPRSLPDGRLVGVRAGDSPAIVLHTDSPTGFVKIAQYAIPAPNGEWQPPVTVDVPYTTRLDVDPGPDRRCGPGDDRFLPLLGDGDDKAVLLLSSASDLLPFRYAARSGATAVPICGGCLPGVLERSDEGLRVLLPVRRSLAGSDVVPAHGFAPARDAETAQAGCTASAIAVAYVVGGRVLVQRSDPELGWRLLPPTVAAAPSPAGTPESPRIVGRGDRLLVLWLRRATNGRARIESVSSADGGVTWN